MKKYKCDICKKYHSVYYGSRSPLPSKIAELIAIEDTDQLLKLDENIYVLNRKQVFLKGSLKIELDYEDYGYQHILWVVVPIEEFRTKGMLLSEGQQTFFKGKIASDNPLLEECEGLETEIYFNQSESIGLIKIIEESHLRTDQSRPISRERFIQTMQRINHPETWTKPEVHKDLFSKRLNKLIQTAITEYLSNQKSFVIDLSNNREVLFQIINSRMINESSHNNLTVYLANDKTNDNYDEVSNNTKSIINSMGYRFEVIDAIDTYCKDYTKDETELLISQVDIILEKVYMENKEECSLDIYEP